MKQKTVVITGASSGIGMEFARAFSKMGCRLILTARRKERLENVWEDSHASQFQSKVQRNGHALPSASSIGDGRGMLSVF